MNIVARGYRAAAWVIACVALLVATLGQTLPAAPAGDPMLNLLLGNPSGARTDSQAKNNVLMVKKYYALSYNDSAGEPNWVSWQLTKEDIGDAPRRRQFAEDDTLPQGFTRIVHKDYTDGGYDRGHMCPHSDRAADRDMSYATFVMTNIIPQAPSVNQKAWAQLEEYLRELVKKENAHIYIVAGPAGKGGWGTHGFKTTIAGGKVIVPATCWKIAVVIPDDEGSGAGDIQKVIAGTRVIAVIMPNDNSVGYSWGQYRTSVAEIEKVTGMHFFSRVRKDVAEALKNKVDDVVIPSQPLKVFGEEPDEPATTAPATRNAEPTTKEQ